MKVTGTTIKGYRLKNGKIEKVTGYGLNASAKIAKKKRDKKPKVVARRKVGP